MASTKKPRQYSKSIVWSLEHLIAPLIVAMVVVFANNLREARKQPKLETSVNEHHITKISGDRFRVECPFTVLNNGGSSIKDRKLKLIIPKSQTIQDVNIPQEYRSFFNKEGGGPNHNYAEYTVNLPKGRKIEGTVVFFSNIKIPDGMNPLTIFY
jgi:hypothetical protein